MSSVSNPYSQSAVNEEYALLRCLQKTNLVVVVLSSSVIYSQMFEVFSPITIFQLNYHFDITVSYVVALDKSSYGLYAEDTFIMSQSSFTDIFLLNFFVLSRCDM